MKQLLLLILLTLPIWCSAQPAALTFTSSNLPILVIDTNKRDILDDPKIQADLGIIDNGVGKRNTITDAYNNFKGKIGIELRGSSSQWYSPKKSYGFETRDAAGANLDVSLLGLPADNDWVLTATFSDKTLMRNALTYSIARSTGHYASRTRFCEVVLNGVYQGVYTLAEKVKRGTKRVNVSKLKTTDQTGDALTGGYIVKLDKATGAAAAAWTSKFQNPANPLESNILFQVEYPKVDDITKPQLAYIQAYVDSFETALNTRPFTDQRRGYRHYIDTKSFIDYFLLTELSRTIDGYCFSTYFSKDRTSKGGKLTMGPAWDYDLAWGNAGFCAGDSVIGWVYSNAHCGGHQVPFWWRKLLSDPAFAQELRDRWLTLRATALSTNSLDELIDANAAQLQESQVRNYTAWPIMGKYVWANAVAFATYNEEVDYLKSWMHRRLTWLDNELNSSTNVVTSNAPASSLVTATVYPTPFTSSLSVSYALASPSAVTLTLYDALGRQVHQQATGIQAAGAHTLDLAGCVQLAPGVYSLRLSSSAGNQTLRIVHAGS